MSSAPAQAQSNPTTETCGLPAGGTIVQTVTYTLSANCELTSTLTVNSDVSMTINGNGNTITASSAITFIQAVTASGNTPTVNLNRVTLDSGLGDNNQPLNIDKLIANQVTFTRNRDGVWGNLSSANHNWNLSNVLFHDNFGLYLFGENQASALDVSGSATLTLHNAAFKQNLFGPSALHITGNSATVTLSGCLTETENLPRFGTGSFTDNSTGACSGTVGNGDSVSVTRAARTACGFPAQGEVRADATYTLSANCQMTGSLWIKEGVTVTINGNGRVIQGNPDNAVIWVGGGARLNIDNLVSQGMRIHVIRGHLEATRLAFVAPGAHRSLFIGGTANLNKLLIRDKTTANRNAVILLDIAESADTSTFSLTITDAIFMDIVNAANQATLWAVDVSNSAATITLNGCISFIRTTGPEVTVAQGVLNDNRTGACPDTLLEEFGRVTPIVPRRDPGSGKGSQTEAATTIAASLPTPSPSTCLTLTGISVSGITESTQCQRLDAVGIGDAEIAAAGFVDAINIWSWVLPNTQICFFASGSAFKFIDTAPMPRVVYDLPAVRQNGLTCATIDRPGNLILLPGEAPPAPAPASESSQSLQNCMVSLQYALNFRAAPNGEIQRVLPAFVTLTAEERAPGWFKVDYHGAKGWVSADYVEPQGTCG